MTVQLTASDKKELSSKRFKWGLALAVGWIVIASLYLTNENARVSANSGIVDSAVSAFSTGAYILLVIVTSPLAFFVSHYIAKGQIETARRQQLTHDETQASLRIKEDQDNRAQRLADMQSQDRLARVKIARTEIIQKLGNVSDYLAALSTIKESEKPLLLQGARKEMRDLVAKYPIQDLVALLKGDEVLRHKVRELQASLKQWSIDSDDAAVLRDALSRSTNA